MCEGIHLKVLPVSWNETLCMPSMTHVWSEEWVTGCCAGLALWKQDLEVSSTRDKQFARTGCLRVAETLLLCSQLRRYFCPLCCFLPFFPCLQ